MSVEDIFDDIQAHISAARADGRRVHRIWLGADLYRAYKMSDLFWAFWPNVSGGNPETLFGIRVLRGDHLPGGSVKLDGL